MAGLVDYGSSDDDGDEHQQAHSQTATTQSKTTSTTAEAQLHASKSERRNGAAHDDNTLTPSFKTLPVAAVAAAEKQLPPAPSTAMPTTTSGPLLGPSIGPGPPPPQSPSSSNPNYPSSPTTAPPSPYTQTRQVIHTLTLPPIPNTSIPPSPPSSPTSHTSSASLKISKFLALKSRGVHFNTKLASSPALRNPALLSNLLRFAGIDEEAGQYASTLGEGLAPVPEKGFAAWAYAEELGRSQDAVSKKREREKARGEREKVEFVGAAVLAPTPAAGGVAKAKDSSTAERESRFDDRGGVGGGGGGAGGKMRRSRSRSPKRRRER